ncbi:AAC(3) family N-acetyltransferase [Acidisoma sp. C75]
MSAREAAVVAATPAPRTRESLARDLRCLGLSAGGTVLVHCSLRSIGWVCGGATAVILALQDVLTGAGTLVMPAHSTQLTDPAGWQVPAVPLAWHDEIRATLPAYDPRTTPTRGMGAVAEQFRTWPGVRRSLHPALSFAALGPEAARITRDQPLDDPFGDGSPLAALYGLGAQILLIGVGFERCTALHLAERRAWPDRPRLAAGAPIMVEGRRCWVSTMAPPVDAAAFPAAGLRLIEAGLVRTGDLGSARCLFMPMAPVVDAAGALWRSA